MRSAETLAIRRIEWRAAVAALNFMVSEHSVFRRSLLAPPTFIDELASIAGTGHNSLSPRPMLNSQEFSIRLLRGWLDRARIDSAKADCHRPDLCHFGNASPLR
jgi:hypothetical protein